MDHKASKIFIKMEINCKFDFFANPQWQIYTWQLVRVYLCRTEYVQCTECTQKLEEELKSSVKRDYVKIKITILGLGLEWKSRKSSQSHCITKIQFQIIVVKTFLKYRRGTN